MGNGQRVDEVRISFTVSAGSELVGKTGAGIQQYWGVGVISIAEPREGGQISFTNPPDIPINAGSMLTVKGPKERVYALLRKGIID